MNETSERGAARRLDVFAIPEPKDGQKAFWPKIGSAFTNRDGSITLILEALPLGTNKLQVREPREPRADGQPAARRLEEVRP